MCKSHVSHFHVKFKLFEVIFKSCAGPRSHFKSCAFCVWVLGKSFASHTLVIWKSCAFLMLVMRNSIESYKQVMCKLKISQWFASQWNIVIVCLVKLFCHLEAEGLFSFVLSEFNQVSFTENKALCLEKIGQKNKRTKISKCQNTSKGKHRVKVLDILNITMKAKSDF